MLEFRISIFAVLSTGLFVIIKLIQRKMVPIIKSMIGTILKLFLDIYVQLSTIHKNLLGGG